MKKYRIIFLCIVFLVIGSFLGAVPSRITLVNSTGYDIEQVFIAPTSWGDWGDDLLEGRTVPDGEKAVITLKSFEGNECSFDVRALDVDGDEYAKYDINICSDPEIVLTFDDYLEPEDSDGSSGSYDEGYNSGYEEGYRAGKQEGFKEGYGQGFKDGFKEGSGKAQ
jgi:hypothetical protein